MSTEAVEHFNIDDAKTHLSGIIERVERGEEIYIDRAGVPVAKIIPLVRPVDRTAWDHLPGRSTFPGTGTRRRPTPRSPRTSASRREPAPGHSFGLWGMLEHLSEPRTVWEVALKQALGKLTGPGDLAERVRDMGFGELPITNAHAFSPAGYPCTATRSTACSSPRPQ
jgi:prevent-host-death family protein